MKGRSSYPKATKPLTFEQRDLSPKELALMIEGRRRKRAVVTVQLEEPEKIMEKLLYRWKAQQALNNQNQSSSDDDDDDLTSSSAKKKKKGFSRQAPFHFLTKNSSFWKKNPDA